MVRKTRIVMWDVLNQSWVGASNNEIQGVTFIVSGEMNMLCKSKRSKNGVRKRCRICAVGVDVYIEVSSYDDFGWRWNEKFKQRRKFLEKCGHTRGRWAVYVDEFDLFVPILEFGDQTFERCWLFEWIVNAWHSEMRPENRSDTSSISSCAWSIKDWVSRRNERFRFRTSTGKRAFSVADPRIWNSLPSDLRTTTSVSSFRSKLKTHCFNIAFPPWTLLFSAVLILWTDALGYSRMGAIEWHLIHIRYGAIEAQ